MTSREHARRFHFLREIASGGFGTVHLVKVMHADGFSRLVAVKLLKAQWSDTDEVARRMRDEARLLGLLRHRNIVDVMDLTSIDGRAAVVMEYLEAVDLRQLVLRLKADGAGVPVRCVLEVVASVAGALDAAYNRPPMPGEKPLRVIHRDIKPSNVMLDESGLVKVLDFGVARSEIDNRESHTQELQFGSVDYMAPERLFFEPETPASDVYSLAATLFEVLAQEKLGKARGRPERHQAFLREQVTPLIASLELAADCAGELESLLLESLAYSHEDRPTAAEFFQRARGLSRMLGGEDLSSWSEQHLPGIIAAVTEERRRASALDDTILLEDSKAFGGPGAAPDPEARPRPTADELRRGALAELEESGHRMISAPPTGAPATGARPQEQRPAAPEDWDDGPTHVSSVSPLLAESTARQPLNTEEVIRHSARDAVAASLPPDPADPFAALSEGSTAPSDPVPVVSLRDSPVPLPLAPGPSPRGRKPVTVKRPAVPPEGLVTTPARVPDRPPGSAELPDLVLDSGDETTAPAEDTAEESPTVLMVAGESGEAEPIPPPPAGGNPIHPADLPDEDSYTLQTPRAPEDEDSLPEGAIRSITVEVTAVEGTDEVAAVEPTLTTSPTDLKVESDAEDAVEAGSTVRRPGFPGPTPLAGPETNTQTAASPTPVAVGEDALPAAPRRNPARIALAAGCLLTLGLGGAVGLGLSQSDRITAAFNAAPAPAAAAPEAPAAPGPSAGSEAVADAEPPAAEAAPAAPVADAEPAAPAADDASPALVFVSLAPDTRKLKARCDTGTGRGETRASVEAEAAAQCEITAIKADRSRVMAVVADLTPGAYHCFAEGKSTCERQ